MTVLFADLVDATALGERLEPEVYQTLMFDYHRICAREIEQRGGQVAQYQGDGVLAYFGHPIALENDAQRAVQSGLAIVSALARLKLDVPLAARVGVHSGLVVTEEGLGGEGPQLSVGGTLNIAARMQSLAEPNSVIISDDTQKLISGYFESVDLGTRELKGLATPMRVYRVDDETGAMSRVEAASGRLTPFIGRDREIATAMECWEEARRGKMQTLVIRGEAGIGKSRLLRELRERTRDAGPTIMECRCAPHREHSALHPIIDMLERRLGIDPTLSPQTRLERLEKSLRGFSDVPDVVPLVAALLSIPLPGGDTLGLNPLAQRQKTWEALAAMACRAADERPLIFAVEDLHWVDPSTVEFLQLLSDKIEGKRVLIVLLVRPGFSSALTDGSRGVVLELERLPSDLVTAMIEQVAGAGSLPADVLQVIREKVDGVPLYIEELTKMILESGEATDGAPAGWRRAPAIPVTLQESLIARLDCVATAKEVVQIASAIGRSFSYRVLRAVWSHGEDALRAEIERLLRAEIVFAQGQGQGTTFLFKHALIQDAAYESMVTGKRRDCHEQIARAFEREFPDVVEAQPETLAYHWRLAGYRREAIRYYSLAGQRAIERSANLEAISHLQAALELIANLAENAERSRLELETQVLLGPALLAIKGYSIEEVERCYERARELCDELGESTKLFYDALTGLFLFHQARGELEAAHNLTRKRLVVADRLGDETLVMQVYENLGTLAFWRGDFEEARAHLDVALSRYDPERGRRIALVYGTDSAVVCNAYAAIALWFLGRADEAQELSAQSVSRARELRHANSLGIALGFAASLHHFLRDGATAQRLAEECIAVSKEHELPLWLTMGKIFRGWALAEQGSTQEGIEQMFDAVSGYQGMGMGLGARLCVAILAQAFLKAGRCDEGLETLEGGLALVSRCEDRFCDAEIHRVKGEFLLGISEPDPQRAEDCFREALELGQRHDSPPLELRAAMSLARFGASRGRRREGRETLQRAYEKFTQGYANRDLVEARELLLELTDTDDRASV